MSQTIQAGVLIIGAGAAGATAAAELRDVGYHGRLTVVNGEGEAPYNRTAVNKGLLQGTMTLDSVALRLPDDDATTVCQGHRVRDLDAGTRTAHLDTGERLEYDAVLVATGADPRPLAVPHAPEAAERIHLLRTAADAVALRTALDRAGRRRGAEAVRVAVVGAGLLGAETADSLAGEGAAVTLIDRNPAPLDRLVGSTVGAWVRRQQGLGMTLALGTSVVGVHAIGETLLVRLSDGTSAVVDVALVAAGVAPATELLSPWLPDARDGLLTDDRLRVSGVAGMYAAGDVARARRGGALVRGEHWGYAVAQGRHAARTIAHDLAIGADPGPFGVPDSFATRLHGKAVTVLGRPAGRAARRSSPGVSMMPP